MYEDALASTGARSAAAWERGPRGDHQAQLQRRLQLLDELWLRGESRALIPLDGNLATSPVSCLPSRQEEFSPSLLLVERHLGEASLGAVLDAGRVADDDSRAAYCSAPWKACSARWEFVPTAQEPT